MAEATFVQEGNTTDYTPGVAVAAGEVIVQGTLVGIAKLDIAANELGALAHTGVFKVEKDGNAIGLGAPVHFIVASNAATATVGANPYLGKATVAALAGDAHVYVRLNQ